MDGIQPTRVRMYDSRDPGVAAEPRSPNLSSRPSEVSARRAAVSGLVGQATTPLAAGAVEAKRRSELGRKLDAFRRDSRLTLTIGGDSLKVEIPFRMRSRGWDRDKRDPASALTVAQRAQVKPFLAHVANGKGTPREIRQVTQMLIDNGALEPYLLRHDEPELAVRMMMKHFKVGLDCSGYSLQAHCHARGVALPKSRTGLPPASSTVHRDPLKALLNAQPGDYVVLGPSRPGEAGHKVVCRSHQVVPGGGELPFTLDSPIPEGFQQGGPIHVYEMDSSWGDGDDPSRGGVMRAVWLYNESSKRWLSVRPDGVVSEGARPYDHPIAGVWRGGG